MDTGFASNTQVSLYVDTDDQDYNGRPIQGGSQLPIMFDSAGNWHATFNRDLSGLTPGKYYAYAIINDGTNTPQMSAYSATPVVVNPPLFGKVLDVGAGRQDPVSGMLVYLDLNHNGQYDGPTNDSNGNLLQPGEPVSLTDSDGLYEFWNAQPGTPYDIGVPIPQGYQLDPNAANNANPRKGVVWQGQASTVENFALDKFAAIKGTVFSDFNQNGALDPGEPGLQGSIVFPDTNGNGILDAGEPVAYTDSNGDYSFLNLNPSSTYTVGLKLQNGQYQTPPIASGSRSLTYSLSADPYQQINGANFGALAFSTVAGEVTSGSVSNSTTSTTPSSLQGWTVNLQYHWAIAAGSTGAGNFQADTDFDGGTVAPTSKAAIDTSNIADPAPQAIYQSNRFGKNFSYNSYGLTPGQTYTVRLQVAETFWDKRGARVFDVAINGQQVLTDFDIFQAAGGKMNTAVEKTFSTVADPQGNLTINFTVSVDAAQINGIEVFTATPAVAINAGGVATGAYLADTDYTGGSQVTIGPTVNTSLLTTPAPSNVYQTYRFGGDFRYVIPNLLPGALYSVRLDFVEGYWPVAGARIFNLDINGTHVLDHFDAFKAAGGMDIAIERTFAASADGSGQIVIHFVADPHKDLAEINAITITPIVASTTTDASGNYSFGNLYAGGYLVSEQVPNGWREISPFASDLQLQTPTSQNSTIFSLARSSNSPISVVSGDFDGDGKQDIAVLNKSGSEFQVQIFYGGGNAAPSVYTISDFDLIKTSGDFYGTGRLDLAILGQTFIDTSDRRHASVTPFREQRHVYLPVHLPCRRLDPQHNGQVHHAVRHGQGRVSQWGDLR